MSFTSLDMDQMEAEAYEESRHAMQALTIGLCVALAVFLSGLTYGAWQLAQWMAR